MKIGDHYDIPLIGFADWQALASACAVTPEILMKRLRHLADRLPEAICAARGQAPSAETPPMDTFEIGVDRTPVFTPTGIECSPYCESLNEW
jgi:hypothetical protein